VTRAGAAPARAADSVEPPAPQELIDRRHAENFPVALRVVPAAEREALLAWYAYARFVDELGDAGVDDPEGRLDALEQDVRRMAAGPVDHPVVAGMQGPARRFGIPAQPLLDLIEANRRDQRVSRYPTFEALRDYCRLSADPVGRVVLHIFGAPSPANQRLSDDVCSALQVIEHLQDVREDLERGRVYLPQDDLRAHGVDDAQLAQPDHPPAVRAVVELEGRRAAAMLREGGRLVGRFRGWRRLALAGYVSGGMAALDALERERWDPGRPPRTASRGRRARGLVASFVRGRA
jgi:squalene synthase HpnC